MFSKVLPFFLFIASLSVFAEEWPVKDALLRVDARVSQSADDPRLGVFLKIQDGGLLPGPYAVPSVFDSKGKALKSLILSNTKKDGLCLLFEDPASGQVSIYISGSKTPPPKPKDCNLIPSLIIYTQNTKSSLEAAKAMSQCYPPAPGAYCHRWSWFASGVNPTGSDDHYIMWLRGAISLPKPEQLYLATVSDEGSEIFLDGRPFVSWPGRHTRKEGARGEYGRKIKLAAGLHSIDYFHFEHTGAQEANAVWRREGAAPDSLPRTINAFPQSGSCRIEKIQLRDGRVCSGFYTESHLRQQGLPHPVSYFWTGRLPLTLFALKAESQPEGGKLFWEFGNGRRFEGSSFHMLVPGMAESINVPVTLAVENAKGTARVTRRLFVPWNPRRASPNNPSDVSAYLTAFLHLVQSKGKGAGASCADWTEDHWKLLLELLAPYRGGKIVELLFKDGAEILSAFEPARYEVLQKRLVEYLRLLGDDKALMTRLSAFEKNAKTPELRFFWLAERIRACLWDLNRPEVAAKEWARLNKLKSGEEQARIALLLAGDIARASDRRERALKFYQEAEDAWRSRGRVKRVEAPAGEAWKTYTVRNSSMYITITSMLEQNATAEAFKLLDEWANESPTAKMDGEYPLAAALVYRKVKDWRRAANILDVYVRQTNFSAQLPDAIKLEIECLLRSGGKKRAEELVKIFSEKFAGHPYEEEIKEMVR